MPDLTSFTRNRCTSVEQIEEQTLRSSCHLQDTLTDAMVEVQIKLPDLEIIHAAGEIRRTHREACLNASDALQKVVGVGQYATRFFKPIKNESDLLDALKRAHFTAIAYRKEKGFD